MNPYAHRLKNIQPFHVMRLLAEARVLEAQGREIIHMEVGEPDFSTPPAILAAGHQALSDGKTFYTPALGLPELREAIAQYYADRYQIELSPERVVVTPGASGALQLLMALLVNPGDSVLMTDPGYPCNRNFAWLYGGHPISVPIAETNFQLTLEGLQSYWEIGQTRAALLTTPSNPTGQIIPLKTLAKIHEFVRAQNGHLIVDEIYQGLTYGVDERSAVSLGEDVFVVNSFSKYFGMTGWRLGWLIAPPDAIPELDKLAQNLFLAASTPAQHAALAAFKPETRVLLDERRERFKRRRDFLHPALENLGFKFPVKPEGAFYLFSDSSALIPDSDVLAKNLLNEAGVCVTPGADFCALQAERYMRFAYTTGIEKLERGVEKIQQYLNDKL